MVKTQSQGAAALSLNLPGVVCKIVAYKKKRAYAVAQSTGAANKAILNALSYVQKHT